MVGGEMQCIGSLGRVKEVHGNVCQLELYCCFRDELRKSRSLRSQGIIGEAESPAEQSLAEKVDFVRRGILQDRVVGENSGCHILEQHAFSQHRFRVVFGVERKNLQMGKLFAWCWKDRLNCIDDFMIGEPTIEQIFLKFAAKQEALLEAEQGS
eukprot:g16213.t1